MYARLQRILFAWRLAYGGILLAVEGMREMDEASDRQLAEDLAQV